MDAATGQTRGQLTTAASDRGELDALRFAGNLDEQWGVGDRGLPARVLAPGAHAGGCGRTGSPRHTVADRRVTEELQENLASSENSAAECDGS